MGTIADKLEYTAQAREEIRAAIVSKGVSCPSTAPFCSFDDYINRISGDGTSVIEEYITENLIISVDAKDIVTVKGLNKFIPTNIVWSDNAMTFNGTSSWINCGQARPSYMTLEVLVKFNAIGGSTEESNTVAGNAQSGGYVINQNNANYAASVYIDTWYALYGSAAAIGEVVYLAFTYDGSTFKFYQNGELVDYVDVVGTIKAPNSSTVLSIGSNPNGEKIGIAPLDGSVYAVRAYSAALTEDDIKSNYSLDKKRFAI